LPFIDIALLKSTIASHCPPNKLTEAERIRNSVGKVYCYRYDVSCTDNVISPGKNIGLPDINGSHSSISIIEENFISSNVTFGPKLVPGTQIPYPGFPSLDVLPIASVELAPIGLNCFGTASKYPNMLLTLHQMPELPPVEVLAENLIGKSVFVNWPMMHEGQVVALSDQTQEIRRVKDKVKKKDFSKAATDKWLSDTQIMSEMYHVGNGVPGSGGVQIGDVKIRLKLLPLQGMKTNPANGSTKKLFGKEEADVPLQLALWKAPAPDPRFEERGPMTLNDRFPEGCSVVLTKGKYRGCMGTVVGVADKKSVGVKVQTMPAEFPFGLAMARSHQDSFVSSVEAARILRIHPGVLGKIMGRLQFEQGRYDLGLNLKNNDGSCVVGYTRKKVEPKKSPSKKGKNNTDKSTAWEAGDSVLVVGSLRGNEDNDDKEERIQWEYTPKAIRLVQSYREKFPQLFAALKKIPNEKKYDANVVFGPNGEAWLPVVREWLDNHETAKLPRTPVSTDSMSYEAIAAVEHTASVRALALKKKGWPKESLIKIPGSALYREGSIGATDVLLASDLNDNQAPMLGDRIVNLCGDGIPFGAKGTVIAIHEAATTGSVEVVMDEEFLGGTSLQGACSNFRGKLCLWSQLLRIATDNSEELVDKLVPKGVTQEKAMNKIISTINRQMKNLPSHINSSWDGTVDSAEADVAAPQVSSCAPSVGLSTCAPSVGLSTLSAPPPAVVQGAVTKEKKRVESRTPPRSSSRAGSTGRARQAGWREARGPDEKGVGFKGTRKTKASGFVRWKNFVKTGSVPGRDAKVDVNLAAAELKKTLRVSAVPDTTSAAPASQTAELKAILGVKPAATPNSVQSSATASNPALTNASDDLKAVLGVGKGVGAAASSTPAAPPVIGPSSAADKLFALMAGKSGRENRSTYQQAPRSASSFSFTYVEEGKEPPAPAPVPPPVMPGPFPPGHLPMQPSPTPPPNVQFGFRPEGLPPMTEHPTLVCAKSTEKGPSVTDYPPLGGANPPAEVPKPIEEAKVERQSSNPTEFMVPASVIASKGNR
jgi:5'-3' exoribonuclease 1